MYTVCPAVEGRPHYVLIHYVVGAFCLVKLVAGSVPNMKLATLVLAWNQPHLLLLILILLHLLFFQKLLCKSMAFWPTSLWLALV